MAIPSQGLWRLSSTLTYADAAGLVLGHVPPGGPRTRRRSRPDAGARLPDGGRTARHPEPGGLCGVPRSMPGRPVASLRPVRRAAGGRHRGRCLRRSRHPRISGAVPWLGLLVILAVARLGGTVAKPAHPPAASGQPESALPGLSSWSPLVAVAALHHEIGLRALAPSDQDRSVEWSTALHQWASAPLVGVGPDRLLVFHAVDGSFAHFVHNEYLQIGADAGAIGAVLLALSVVAVIRSGPANRPVGFLCCRRPWSASPSPEPSISTGISASSVCSEDGAWGWRRQTRPLPEATSCKPWSWSDASVSMACSVDEG